MKKYKILIEKDDEYFSPFQWYKYGRLSEFLNKPLHCSTFDSGLNICADGFYATDIDGLIYTKLDAPNKKVFEVEVSGKQVIIDNFKQRFEDQTFLRKLSDIELHALVKDYSDSIDWDYYHALFPVNPFKIAPPDKITEEHISLLKEWASVWSSSSVGNSVRSSVETSVGNSVWSSVWSSVGIFIEDSVEDSVGSSIWSSVEASVRSSIWSSVRSSVGPSVWDFVWAYTSSLFPNVKKWRDFDHEPGTNPFQSAIDLWHKGLVPSFDGETWRLHSVNGIVWESKVWILKKLTNEKIQNFN